MTDSATVMPMITTVIPTYRRPKLLRRAIRSVLNQTYPHFQVCVYDNASGDTTADIVRTLSNADKRVKYYCHSHNIGAAKNFNFALQNVGTPFFSIMSDDDILLPTFYETALNETMVHPDAAFVATGVLGVNRFYDIVPELHVSTLRPGVYRPPDSIFDIIDPNPPTWTGMLFRKAVLDQIGFLDEQVGTVSDMDFVLQTALRNPFVYTHVPGAIFVAGAISTQIESVRGKVDSFWPGWMRMADKLERATGSDDSRAALRNILSKQLERRLLTLGLAAIVRGDYVDGFKAADVLHYHCGCGEKAFFMRMVASWSRNSSLVRAVVNAANEIRFQMNRIKQKGQGRSYRSYKNYLHVDE